MNNQDTPYIETRRDEDVTVRLVVQFDSEDGPNGGWFYSLNGVRITAQMHADMKLPF